MLNTLSPVTLNSPACKSILPSLLSLLEAILNLPAPSFTISPAPLIFDVISIFVVLFIFNLVFVSTLTFSIGIFLLISNVPAFTSKFLKFLIFRFSPSVSLASPSFSILFVSCPLFSTFNLFNTLSLDKSILIFELSLAIIFVSVFNDLSSFSVNVEFSKFKFPLNFSISFTSTLEFLNVKSALPFTLLLNTLFPVTLNSPACRSILPVLFNLEPSISIFVVPTFIKSPVPVISEVIVPLVIKFKSSFVLSFKSIFETSIFFLSSNSPDLTSNVLKLTILVLSPKLNLPLPSLITLLVFPSLVFLFSKFILVTSISLSDKSFILLFP